MGQRRHEEPPAARAVPAVRQEDTAGIRGQGRLSGGPGASTLPVGIGGSVSAWSTGIGVSLQIRRRVAKTGPFLQGQKVDSWFLRAGKAWGGGGRGDN